MYITKYVLVVYYGLYGVKYMVMEIECRSMVERQPTDETDRSRPLVIDLYCGHGGVGLALDELDVEYIGVDIEDRSDTYPGEFVRADASQPPLDADADLVWASPPCTAYSDLSPTHYGSRKAAMESCPTIPELRVREIAKELGAEYVIENVPGASREGHLRRPTRVNGLAFGKPYDLERHFETSFFVPDAVEPGEPTVKVQTRDGQDQSAQSLAEAKGVPASWGKQGVRSAIPREYVHWLLSFCPTIDAPRPRREQQTLLAVADGGKCTENISNQDP